MFTSFLLCLLFYSAGADPSIRNKEGVTPAEMASKLGHTVLANLFAEKIGSQMLSKWHS